ncbi:type II/IV secretion system ATPase subunit, partial [archaeon]|nr:type II/IV secretion system ATPase subunit [archaeon]
MSARTTVGGRRILASYPLLEPLVHVTIEEDVETKKIRYVVHEPRLSKDDRRLMQLILQILEEELILTRESIPETKEDAAKLLHKAIKEIVQKYHLLNLKKEEDRQRFERIAYYIVRDHIYLGRIYPLLLDERIEDISCAGPGLPIYVWHEDYEFIPTNIVYRSDEELDSFIVRLAYLARRQISLANPLLDAALPDGSRIQLSYGREVTKRGSSFTIRRSRSTPLTIVNIVRLNTLSSEMGAYVWFLLEHKRSIMVAGPTACGKTTTLNCFTMFFRPDIKIVSIEETPELQLAHENWLQSVARRGFGTGESFIGEVTLFDLLKAAMRQRPDFIIVGEIRGAEAYTLFQAIATGHGGMCTIHADSAEAAIHRLTSPPMNIPHPLLPNMNLLCVQI